MRVPREIDELMWVVAEERDPCVVNQFLERYPEFEDELAQRVKMVSGLKGSRPNTEATQFVPREQVRHFGPSRLAVAGIAALLLLSVTFASYATVQYVNSKRSPRPLIEAPQIVFTAPKFEAPQSTGGTGLDALEGQVPNFTDVPPVRQEQLPPDPYLNPVTIESEDMALSEAVTKIAALAGLRATIAPGFDEKRIKLRFINQPALDVINLMGARFGFKALKEGTVDLLIIPVAPTEAGAAEPVPGSLGTAPTKTNVGGPTISETQGTTGTGGN